MQAALGAGGRLVASSINLNVVICKSIDYTEGGIVPPSVKCVVVYSYIHLDVTRMLRLRLGCIPVTHIRPTFGRIGHLNGSRTLIIVNYSTTSTKVSFLKPFDVEKGR